ncbi:MAG TPA: polyprenyl diphosphate synthase [Caulobacteraceae bacterium]|nr:polyprenyl diphosphate synthase [Caulobacteraceae bacterium]
MSGFHVAIAMDGNGRWATRRGLPRPAGHLEGARTVRRIVEAASELGVTTLTLFAFGSNNWKRPPDEVAGLMRLLEQYLHDDAWKLIERGARLTLIGRRDRLPPHLLASIARIEAASRDGDVHLRIAIDYSAREQIVQAAAECAANVLSLEDFGRRLAGGDEAEAVDLMIRTGGEKRLSDFLLWECAYAELFFTDVLWPDFTPEHLAEAVADFHRRDRRYGAVSQAAAG